MSYYNGATICQNGHIISKHDSYSQKYCSKCGATTYSHCQYCNSPIRGLYEVSGVVIIGNRRYEKPNYCHTCGKPYPWTEQILNNAIELLALDSELNPEIKELIKNAIPDLLVDTPTTPLAAAKYQKGISQAGDLIKNSFHNLLVDVISETAKKILFP